MWRDKFVLLCSHQIIKYKNAKEIIKYENAKEKLLETTATANVCIAPQTTHRSSISQDSIVMSDEFRRFRFYVAVSTATACLWAANLVNEYLSGYKRVNLE